MDFSGKKVLITGGSKGIGRATALAFAKKGARVAINFKNDKQAAAATTELLNKYKPKLLDVNDEHDPEKEDPEHIAIRADIGLPSSAELLVKQVIEQFDGLDIVVNNAGVFIPHPADQSTYEQWQEAWRQTLRLNLLAASNVTFCAAQHMIQHGGGRIVNVSSRGAFRGEPDHPAYAASKAGLNAMSQSLAQALGKYKIFIGVVAPGFVETPMTREILDGPGGDAIRRQSPMNRVATAEEVAQAILFLASEGAEFTTGTILDVNGASYLRS